MPNSMLGSIHVRYQNAQICPKTRTGQAHATINPLKDWLQPIHPSLQQSPKHSRTQNYCQHTQTCLAHTLWHSHRRRSWTTRRAACASTPRLLRPTTRPARLLRRRRIIGLIAKDPPRRDAAILPALLQIRDALVRSEAPECAAAVPRLDGGGLAAAFQDVCVVGGDAGGAADGAGGICGGEFAEGGGGAGGVGGGGGG